MPMRLRLFDRQREIIGHLTSPDFAFGTMAVSAPALGGFDMDLLRLEAELSFFKRMGKLSETFAKTTEALGARRLSTFREFATLNRPTTFVKYEEAKVFARFLREKWANETPQPAYLPDLLNIELMLSKLSFLRANSATAANVLPLNKASSRAIRLSEATEIVHCSHDVRALFEGRADGKVPARAMTLLLALVPPRYRPRIFELSDDLRGLVEKLTDWVAVTSAQDLAPGISIDRLISLGILEERR
jgi:hypothetical protein